MARLRDNISVRQLQLFTPAELDTMRDRSALRNYSPERDEFRRQHERRRAWGLIQRRGQRLRHLRNSSRAPGSGTLMPDDRREAHRPARVPAPTQVPTQVSAQVPTGVPAQVPALALGSAPAPALQTSTAERSDPPRHQIAPLIRSRHSDTHHPITPESSRPAPNAPPPAATPPAGRPAHSGHSSPAPTTPAIRVTPTIRSTPASKATRANKAIPRPPRPGFRQTSTRLAGDMIDFNTRSAFRHPMVSPMRPTKARGPPHVRDPAAVPFAQLSRSRASRARLVCSSSAGTLFDGDQELLELGRPVHAQPVPAGGSRDRRRLRLSR